MLTWTVAVEGESHIANCRVFFRDIWIHEPDVLMSLVIGRGSHGCVSLRGVRRLCLAFKGVFGTSHPRTFADELERCCVAYCMESRT
jgi:hypothetical protein